MNEKRLRAIWNVTKDLAERLVAAREQGLIVLDGDSGLVGEIELDDEKMWFAIRDGNCSTVFFDAHEDGFGHFESIKEAREYFAKQFTICKPIRLARVRKTA
jgi:hypothetical protein